MGGARPIAVIVAMLAVALLLGALAAPAAALSAARPTTEPGSDRRPGAPGEGPGRTVEAPDPFSGLGIGGFDGFEVDEPGPDPRNGDVALELVDAVQSAQDDPPPIPIPLLPSNDPQGTLAGNDWGCASTCVTQAEVQQHLVNTDLGITMTTNVLTTKTVWLLPAGPAHAALPAIFSTTPVEVSPTNYAWSVDIEDLPNEVSYRIVIEAEDNQGNTDYVSTIVTTSPGVADDWLPAGGPCYLGCIEAGWVEAGETPDTATVHVVANAPVVIDIAVSPSEPGMIAGNPILSNQVPMALAHVDAFSRSVDISDLEGDTVYHVVAKATDTEGFRHYAVGQFTTPEFPTTEVFIHFERAHIHETGDAWGNGEIHFTYGFEDNFFVVDPASYGEGAGVNLDHGHLTTVEYGGTLPALVINGHERDNDEIGIAELPCAIGPDLFYVPHETDCGDTVAVGFASGITLDWVRGLPLCEEFDVTGYTAGAYCFVLSSEGLGSDYVQFDTLIAIHVYE